MKTHTFAIVLVAASLAVAGERPAGAQDRKQGAQDRKTAAPADAAARAATVTPAANYIIGPDDVLSVVFWRDKDMSGDVVVRPDGKISLPLMNDVQAGGLTPSQLRDAVNTMARQYVEDPNVTVVVKEIKSRKVFITGMVEKPGPYPLNGPTSVVQLISVAGGLKEFTDGKKILIMRTDRSGRQSAHLFNYQKVVAGKNLEQNIELQPGDTVVVP
jgi:polysaccharide export outer membrane protein